MTDSIKAATTKLIESNKILVEAARKNQKKVKTLQRMVEVMFFVVALMIGYFIVLTTLTSDKVDVGAFEKTISHERQRSDQSIQNVAVKINHQNENFVKKFNQFQKEQSMLATRVQNQESTFVAQMNQIKDDINTQNEKVKIKLRQDIKKMSSRMMALSSDFTTIVASHEKNQKQMKKQIDLVQNLNMIQETLGVLNKKMLEIEADFSRLSSNQNGSISVLTSSNEERQRSVK